MNLPNETFFKADTYLESLQNFVDSSIGNLGVTGFSLLNEMLIQEFTQENLEREDTLYFDTMEILQYFKDGFVTLERIFETGHVRSLVSDII